MEIDTRSPVSLGGGGRRRAGGGARGAAWNPPSLGHASMSIRGELGQSPLCLHDLRGRARQKGRRELGHENPVGAARRAP